MYDRTEDTGRSRKNDSIPRYRKAPRASTVIWKKETVTASVHALSATVPNFTNKPKPS